MVADELARLNPGFTGDEKTKLEAYLVLDIFETRDGSNNIKNETIKEASWTYREGRASSSWRDMINQMISEYKTLDSGSVAVSGIERCDSKMAALRMDNLAPPSYGLGETEWEQDYEP